ncbi:low molecular weight protein-tyrosine-phosphatase [Spectribacter hydrogenoxidans]|uniref:protein-tyrosine-phosphatase n=1 Tax=Spectribacter hydrogenoxidans TaxID=3075608 RepID=A0ABU3BXT1_9GAMM|nr:low molecular weight protein-tyrosine-phosphatase [Salinisphaera sp. W335]MDT0633936.1 low molecular weight protein-tyrosine-phosphatase [Salinisphaera sp. W335]
MRLILIKRVSTVCTGNICRSPLAEAILRKALPECEVTSAGVGALVGYPAEDHAQAIASENGLDIMTHRARQVTAAWAAEQDLILTMDAGHNEWFFRHAPQIRGRIFLLGHWQNTTEVPDPYGHDRAAFEKAFAQISAFSADWISRIRVMNG